MAPVEEIDRLAIRKRPVSLPLMHQSWQKILFLHWRLAPELLRPHLPPSLSLDTFDGEAWISVTPFLVRNLRPLFLPALPFLSDFHEVNVRTYVHAKGVPGVWFFSLDASSFLAVLGARVAYLLPYHHARMDLREEEDRILFSSSRTGSNEQRAELEVGWRKGGTIGEAAPDSLAFFLVERYCLYAADRGGRLYRARIHHPPWALRQAEPMTLRCTMLQAQGLPSGVGNPLLHYAERRDVSVWPLRKVE